MRKINFIYITVSLVLLLTLAFGAGCTIITGSETSQNTSEPVIKAVTPIDSDYTLTVQGTQPALPSIADVVAKVKPSVVAINTEILTLDFFNRPFTQEGAGSGWIIREDGIIITNNHVVEGATNITVTLDDGSTYTVDMDTVATDSLIDLAVLKINANNLPAATVGNSDVLRVGDWVVAIGNSLGLGISATKGIVSALEVQLSPSAGQTLSDLIQTDAAINPGNSGGPLLNMAGEVIGINSIKIAQEGVEGMGYAISSAQAMPILTQLINSGYVVRPWLGVGLYTVDQFVVQRYDLAVDRGALVVNIAPGSPCDLSNIQSGDVIITYGGQEITSVDELIMALHASEVGQEVEIIFWRAQKQMKAVVTLVESPPPSG